MNLNPTPESTTPEEVSVEFPYKTGSPRRTPDGLSTTPEPHLPSKEWLRELAAEVENQRLRGRETTAERYVLLLPEEARGVADALDQLASQQATIERLEGEKVGWHEAAMEGQGWMHKAKALEGEVERLREALAYGRVEAAERLLLYRENVDLLAVGLENIRDVSRAALEEGNPDKKKGVT